MKYGRFRDRKVVQPERHIRDERDQGLLPLATCKSRIGCLRRLRITCNNLRANVGRGLRPRDIVWQGQRWTLNQLDREGIERSINLERQRWRLLYKYYADRHDTRCTMRTLTVYLTHSWESGYHLATNRPPWVLLNDLCPLPRRSPKDNALTQIRMMRCRRNQATGHLENALWLAKTRSKSHASIELIMLIIVNIGSHNLSKPIYRVRIHSELSHLPRDSYY
jgi:hypothetical protein